MQDDVSTTIRKLRHSNEYYKQENTLLKQHNISLRKQLEEVENALWKLSMSTQSEESASPPQHMLYVPTCEEVYAPVHTYHAGDRTERDKH